MFRIKICGITNVEDARAAVAAGADAIGLNFYPRSKRFLNSDEARAITRELKSGVTKVGVFVNHTADEIDAIAAAVEIDAIQLHGDEPPEFLAALPDRIPIVRAFRCGAEGLAPLASYLAACCASGRMPAAVLIDADAGASYGGTGCEVDWLLVARERAQLGDVRLILAGGLTPATVCEAISAVQPDGVDVASGVDREPGRKDQAMVREFVRAAQVAFKRL